MEYLDEEPAPNKREPKPTTLITFAASAIPTRDVTEITIRRLDTGETISFAGRAAWTLAELAKAGSEGFTSRSCPPGLRLAHHVFLLRRAGLSIDTATESHSGSFAGHHARYRITTPISVLEITEAGGDQ